MAEVEPFKTAITLHFDRSWPFVTYAVLLLVVNIFTRKVYCRYLCPLRAPWHCHQVAGIRLAQASQRVWQPLSPLRQRM